jgi:hypothetical protein
MTKGLLLFLLGSLTAGCGVFAQTKIVGNTVINGATTINPGSTYTHMYVVFPPQSNPFHASNNTNFKTNVMPQNAIEGVTIPVMWNLVEAGGLPSTTPCPNGGTDLCQQDPMATSYYHTYSWGIVDGPNGFSSPCMDTTTGSSSQWFCDFPSGSGHFKTVNFAINGQGTGAQATPTYVTSAPWAAAIAAVSGSGYLYQDVVNSVNAGTCAQGYTGTPLPNPPGTSWKGDNVDTTISVTWSGNPFQAGDSIWVSGFAVSAFNVVGQHGGTILTRDDSGFTYVGSGVTNVTINNPPGITAVAGLQSWIVPYENPYASAYQAFLKAAIYHFNHYNNIASGFQQTTKQIGYVRPGVGRQSEATPICTTELEFGGIIPSNPVYSQPIWEGWYATVNSAVQSAGPLMQIMFSIDAGDPLARDASYATDEAGIAVSHSNAVGMYNGFGSQGLANSDQSTFVLGNCDDTYTGAPNTNENWGCMFAKYWSGATGVTTNMPAVPTTVPLELQQVDCSNPTGYSSGSGTCFLSSHPPGMTGDLRTLYPFAVTNHVSILELYSQDALLAYDTKFCDVGTSCTLSGGSCNQTVGYDWFGTSLSADEQCNFFENVGQGVSCTTGGCYDKAINAAQGNH